jgi:hypothetical protein
MRDPIRIKEAVNVWDPRRGDLNVTLVPPANLGAQPEHLHGRTGARADDIKRVFDVQSARALAQLVGRTPSGARPDQPSKLACANSQLHSAQKLSMYLGRRFW